MAPAIRAVARENWRSLGLLALVSVTATTILTKGPLLLPGALGDFIRADVGVGASGIGLIIATYWTGSIIGAYISRHTDAHGLIERRTGQALMVTALSLWAAAIYPSMGLWVGAAAGGVVYGYTQPHTNFLIVHRCSDRIRGVAFGTKQAAIPLAVLFSALAVPVIAVPLGWRSVLAIVGFLCAARAVSLMLRPVADDLPSFKGAGRSALKPTIHLVVLALAGACGSAVGNSAGGFLLQTMTQTGSTVLIASLVTAAGSLTAIIVRIMVGRISDRAEKVPQGILVWLFLIGAIGALLISVPTPFTQTIGALLAFGVERLCGW